MKDCLSQAFRRITFVSAPAILTPMDALRKLSNNHSCLLLKHKSSTSRYCLDCDCFKQLVLNALSSQASTNPKKPWSMKTIQPEGDMAWWPSRRIVSDVNTLLHLHDGLSYLLQIPLWLQKRADQLIPWANWETPLWEGTGVATADSMKGFSPAVSSLLLSIFCHSYRSLRW